MQPLKVQHRVPLTQKMTQRASRRGISYGVLGEGRCSVAAVPVLNEYMCGVKYTPKHSRADGCTHNLRVRSVKLN